MISFQLSSQETHASIQSVRRWLQGKWLFSLAVLFLLGFPLTGQAEEPANRVTGTDLEVPNRQVAGKLVIAGGGRVDPVLDHFVKLAGGDKAKIVIIPTASVGAEQPDLLPIIAYWKARGVDIHLLHTRNRAEANDPRFIEPLRHSTGVWIGGGDQSKLMTVYKGTAVEKELHRLLAKGMVIGGTSAGAAAMSSVMIVGGNPEAKTSTGFGFLSRVVVDQHFQNRQRLERLFYALAQHPRHLGLGIDEQTAVVVAGSTVTVLGKQNVRVCWQSADPQEKCVKILKAGDQIDLLEMFRTAVTSADTGRHDSVSAALPNRGEPSATLAEAPSTAP